MATAGKTVKTEADVFEIGDLACPRCGGAFECGANAGRCDCFELRLPEGLRAEIAARWPDRCLCLNCLRQLGAQPVLTPPSSGAQA